MKRNYKKVTFKTKDDWLKAKEKTISGSEAAAICNKSKWLSVDDLFNKMVYGKAKVIPENEFMRRGTVAESHIRELFPLTFTKFTLKNPPKKSYSMFIRKDKPYMSCTPDGHIIENETGKKFGIEIKNCGLRKKADINAWEGGLLPDQYYYQILQYMLVENDLEGVVLFAKLDYYKHIEETDSWEVDHSVLKPYWVYRKDVESHLKYLEKKETDFYEINIKGRRRPKVVINFNN